MAAISGSSGAWVVVVGLSVWPKNIFSKSAAKGAAVVGGNVASFTVVVVVGGGAVVVVVGGAIVVVDVVVGGAIVVVDVVVGIREINKFKTPATLPTDSSTIAIT
jgi:hypothetical protein